MSRQVLFAADVLWILEIAGRGSVDLRREDGPARGLRRIQCGQSARYRMMVRASREQR